MNALTDNSCLRPAAWLRIQLMLAALLLPLLMEKQGLCQAPVIPADVIANIQQRVTNGFTPAIVVGLINSNGTTFFSYGARNLESGEPADENSIFEIGSITKTFTCTVLSQLLLDGSLVLTNPVQSYLPGNVRVPSRNGKVITLAHLATHRSGLPRMPTNLAPADPSNPHADYTVQQLYDFLASYQLPRDPGAACEYSNIGMGLAGHVLSLHAGSDYESLVAERITQPLGMTDTSVRLTPRMAANLAHGHSGIVQMPNWDFGPPFVGAGALRSSAHDLLQYVAANMGLVQTGLYLAMTNAHTALYPANFPDNSFSIGLAWLSTPIPGDQIVCHGGATAGYRTFAGFLRSKRLGVVVLASSDFAADDIGFHLLDPARPLNPLRSTIVADLDTLRSCVGRFRGNSGDYFDISLKHGHLTFANSQAEGWSSTLYPASPRSFFATAIQATATFPANSLGICNALIWNQSGYSSTYNRVALPSSLILQRHDGQTRLTFTGDTGVNYVLEASQDLTNWTPISTNTIWAQPFVDTEPAATRFYRLRRP